MLKLRMKTCSISFWYFQHSFNLWHQNNLFSMQAANFLDVKDLLDLTCKTVAEYIKQCKTPEEIRQRFNIPNDFTPEEEEEVRKENAWCEEAP
mmetsp:Transcript_67735/g.181205  ORF Transcript_67735/g.181205 Transcript_67735/m.181205 type:complete len:93 (+) Transcript_67735:333-611(+)